MLPLGTCAVPDSIAVRGNDHVDEATIRGDAGLVAGANLNYRDIQRAIRAIFATGQFDDVKITCNPASGAGTRTVVAITVKERPVLSDVRIEGVDRVSNKAVRDRIEIPEARPLNPRAGEPSRRADRFTVRSARVLPGAREARNDVRRPSDSTDVQDRRGASAGDFRYQGHRKQQNLGR